MAICCQIFCRLLETYYDCVFSMIDHSRRVALNALQVGPSDPINEKTTAKLLRKISLSGDFPFAHLLTLVIATLLINLTYTTLYRVNLAPNLFDVDAFAPSLVSIVCYF